MRCMEAAVARTDDAPARPWHFYLSPAEAWEAMYADCAQARESIEFEQYILENDEVGRRFMEIFLAKAKENVRIFILCDLFGSIAMTWSPLVKKLRAAGADFHFYHRLRIWELLMPWRWFPRTHTKTL